MPVEPLVELIDSIKYVLPALLLVIGIALMIVSHWQPALLLPGVKIMGSSVFVFPVLAVVSLLAHSPFSREDDFGLWIATTLGSIVLIVIPAVTALVWLARAQPSDKRSPRT